MLRDFTRWPKYKDMYIRAFKKMIEAHPGKIKFMENKSAYYDPEEEKQIRKILNITEREREIDLFIWWLARS
jgi:hypothetical protein